jgi:hypothetical protein
VSYATYEVETATPWLSGTWGRRWNYVSGLIKDGWREAAQAAVKARFASLAPPDALAKLLRDYVLDPPYGEPLTQTRARLLRAWETWQLAGTRRGLLVALEAAGYPNVLIQERPAGMGARWWHFGVILLPPFPWDPDIVPKSRWGRFRWGDGTRYVELVPRREKERVAALIRKWKPAHAQCTGVVARFEGRLYGDGWRSGDGTRWGGLAVRWSV